MNDYCFLYFRSAYIYSRFVRYIEMVLSGDFNILSIACAHSRPRLKIDEGHKPIEHREYSEFQDS